MPAEGEHLSRIRAQNDDLEAYRRLIELQKQMIELSQQHEQAKRECAALREQVTGEIAQRFRARQSLRQRLQRTVRRLAQRMPGWPPTPAPLDNLNRSPSSSC
jgi:outer membrane protein TolC